MRDVACRLLKSQTAQVFGAHHHKMHGALQQLIQVGSQTSRVQSCRDAPFPAQHAWSEHTTMVLLMDVLVATAVMSACVFTCMVACLLTAYDALMRAALPVADSDWCTKSVRCEPSPGVHTQPSPQEFLSTSLKNLMPSHSVAMVAPDLQEAEGCVLLQQP